MTEETIPDEMKSFNITSFCKADMMMALHCKDLPKLKEKIEALTETEMKWVARKMADSYCECCFWTALNLLTLEVLNDVQRPN